MKNMHHIGSLITHIRDIKGITQKELANEIGTSQSAIARIERGDQNITIDMVAKISKALNRQLLSFSGEVMSFQIKGGNKLHGTVTANTSKNATMALLAASILNKKTTIIRKAPRIEEVARMSEVLESIGFSLRWIDNDLEIKPPAVIDLKNCNEASARMTRSILMFAAPLAHHFKDFRLPVAGGCHLGSRSIKPHIKALESFGVRVTSEDNYLRIRRTGATLSPATIVMYESGDTATNQAILAASSAPGCSIIRFASANYMVQDLCYFLVSLGVKIQGIGTSTLTITGNPDINQHAYAYPSEDPTEVMFFLSASIVTGSSITIKRAPIAFLELELEKLKEMGFSCEVGAEYSATNGHTRLVDITTKPSRLRGLGEADKVEPRPYPGINIDNLPFFVVIATMAEGKTLIHDWVYEKRAIYYMELERLGANLELLDPHRVNVYGPTAYTAKEVICPRALRPATIILIAMLGAKGTSLLREVYSINRGYENLVERLNKLGANISLLTAP